jgi:hypothetical protein
MQALTGLMAVLRWLGLRWMAETGQHHGEDVLPRARVDRVKWMVGLKSSDDGLLGRP